MYSKLSKVFLSIGDFILMFSKIKLSKDKLGWVIIIFINATGGNYLPQESLVLILWSSNQKLELQVSKYFDFFIICMYVACVIVPGCHGMSVALRGEHWRISSLFVYCSVLSLPSKHFGFSSLNRLTSPCTCVVKFIHPMAFEVLVH